MSKIKSVIKNKNFINASAMVIEKIIELPVVLFVGFYVARYLGPDNYGILNYCLSVISIISVFSALGLDSIVLRDLVKTKDKDTLLGTAVRIKFFAALFAFAFSLLIAYTQNNYLVAVVIAVLSIDLILSSLNPVEWFFQSQVEIKYVACVRFFITVLVAAYRLFLVYNSCSLVYFAYSGIIGTILGVILNFMIYNKKYGSFFKWKYDFSLAKRLLTDSWTLILSGLVAIIYMRIDQLMITNMLDSSANGNYAAAVKISEMYYFIPGTASSALLPWLINGKIKDNNIYLSRLNLMFFSFFWLSIFCASFVAFFSSSIIELCYGLKYVNASSVLSIHIWTGVIVSLGLITNKWIIAENLQRYEFSYLIVGAIVNVVLNYLLIPRFGINGAAFATLVAQLVANIISPLFYIKTRGIVFVFLKGIISVSKLKKGLFES